jgi:hypothetical protein
MERRNVYVLIRYVAFSLTEKYIEYCIILSLYDNFGMESERERNE